MQAALRDRIIDHYDELSPYYRELWGSHIHHGYYLSGTESKEEAAEKLLELLIERCKLRPNSRVLDVGCGVGGTCIYLAERLGCRVVGLTISEVQAAMAHDAVTARSPSFLVADAMQLPVRGRFDAILAMEVLSHLDDRGAFFSEVPRLLESGGKLGIAAWLKGSDLSPADERSFILPIEQGMLVRLPTKEAYERELAAVGLELLVYEDISAEVCRTWDLCLEIIGDRSLWAGALQRGREVIEFLRSFKAMQRGFASGAFRYAVLVAEK